MSEVLRAAARLTCMVALAAAAGMGMAAGEPDLDRKDIMPMDFHGERSFVVLYGIDIGCSGGSGAARGALAREWRREITLEEEVET